MKVSFKPESSMPVHHCVPQQRSADEQSAELANGETAARRRGGVGCRKARAERLIKKQGRQEKERDITKR